MIFYHITVGDKYRVADEGDIENFKKEYMENIGKDFFCHIPFTKRMVDYDEKNDRLVFKIGEPDRPATEEDVLYIKNSFEKMKSLNEKYLFTHYAVLVSIDKFIHS